MLLLGVSAWLALLTRVESAAEADAWKPVRHDLDWASIAGGYEKPWEIGIKSVAFISGHIGKARALPPIPNRLHSFFIMDELGPPKYLGRALESYGWRVLRLPGSAESDAVNSTMRAKLLKIPQDRWPALAPYDFVVWFDDKFRLNVTGVYDVIARWPKNAAAAFHRHPSRCTDTFPDCSVLEEVEDTLQHRYKRQHGQMKRYIATQERVGLRSTGRPLYQAGFIIYNRKHPATRALQAKWLEHIRIAGVNDQVSLFFIAQLFARHIIEFRGDWGWKVWNGYESPPEGEYVAVLG